MLYPIKFIPRLKERLWGGTELLSRVKQGKGAKIDPTKPYGESWDLSSVAGDESVVANGYLKRNTIEEIVEVYMGNLVGEKNYDRYGLTFPLLIKSLECCDTLSVQVHPDDEAARRRGYRRGKTEMWYIMPSVADAKLYCGFRHDMTEQEYRRRVAEGTLCEALRQYGVAEGDAFFLPTGRVHAIGAGCMLAEVQQASDVTYRMHDYGRRDKDGRERQLHVDEAAEVTQWSTSGDERIRKAPQAGRGVELAGCDYFCVVRYDVEGDAVPLAEAAADSFVILIGVAGEGTVTAGNGREPLRCGESLLVAAECTDIRVEGRVSLLAVYVP